MFSAYLIRSVAFRFGSGSKHLFSKYLMINSKDDATILNHLSENYFKEDAPKILGVVKPG